MGCNGVLARADGAPCEACYWHLHRLERAGAATDSSHPARYHLLGCLCCCVSCRRGPQSLRRAGVWSRCVQSMVPPLPPPLNAGAQKPAQSSQFTRGPRCVSAGSEQRWLFSHAWCPLKCPATQPPTWHTALLWPSLNMPTLDSRGRVGLSRLALRPDHRTPAAAAAHT
jgi:hypothetical protein